jgi:hypothetical protein
MIAGHELGRTKTPSYPASIRHGASDGMKTVLLATFQILFLLAIASPVLWALFVKPLLIVAVSPRSDVLRIKRDYEGRGRRVLNATRRGTIWGSRSMPSYRRYDVEVLRHDGQVKTFEVGVQFTLLSDPDLREEDPARRKAFFQGSASCFGLEG